MTQKDTFIIEGLAGEKKLHGTVQINGAKNAALKAMAAAILFDGEVTLCNVPDTDDIHTMTKILKKLGATVIRRSSQEDAHAGLTLKINTTEITSTDIDPKLGRTMRASIVLTGPLLARFGNVSFPAPGGCVIGARPVDLFIDGYKKMGAVVTLKNDIYHIVVDEGIKSAEVSFSKITVGGTETLMMAAVLGKGKTVLKNCAKEPEIVNVAEWLNASGAKITGVGTPTIEIEGTNEKLLSHTQPYVAIPDRIETGSFLILGALCAHELVIERCQPEHNENLISLLKDSGVPISTTSSTITIANNTQPNSSFKSTNVRTHEYPGFPTDLQAPFAVYLTQATGRSMVLETIFEGRFKYVEDLVKMGANITTMNPHEILITGSTPLAELPAGEELQAYDIRAGFAIVLAALVGKGKFIVGNVHLIDRGYEKLEERLSALGASVKREVL